MGFGGGWYINRLLGAFNAATPGWYSLGSGTVFGHRTMASSLNVLVWYSAADTPTSFGKIDVPNIFNRADSASHLIRLILEHEGGDPKNQRRKGFAELC